jgi:glutamate decarboxylase
VKPSVSTFTVDAKEMIDLVDEKTIAVVGILGNHYNGAYDKVWEIDAFITELNKEKGWQVGIHVDAASGGFIAPFQDGMPPFDFRLPSVLSISASGHKFGQSVCGTGWLVFRQRADLAEHIAISVSYLGGKCDSMTLNFSRHASGPYVQLFKFLRLGRPGYKALADNQMGVASFIRTALKGMKHPSGEPRFEILDGGEKHCLPVVGARLNPKLTLV